MSQDNQIKFPNRQPLTAEQTDLLRDSANDPMTSRLYAAATVISVATGFIVAAHNFYEATQPSKKVV